MKSTFTIFCKLILMGSIVFFAGCKDDDELIVDDSETYIREESLFGCDNYQVISLAQDFNNSSIIKQGEDLFVGGSRGFSVYNSSTGEFKFFDDSYTVNDFEYYENSVIICAREGIYEYVNFTEIMQRVDVNCTDLLLTADNELIFATNSSPSFDILKLYRYDSQTGVEAYTDQNSGSLCVTQEKLTQASNGDIWTIDCSGNYVRYRDGSFVNIFNNTNSPLFDLNRPVSSSFVEPYGDAMVVVTKNGTSNYLVLKYEGEQWITLYDLKTIRDNTPELSDQDIEMSLPSLVGAQIKGDFLYVATTAAGCKGFHVFDVSKNSMLSPDDYYIVRDPELSDQCIDAFEIDKDCNFYIVTGDEMVVIDC